jgi:hypothetical protein
MRRLFLAAPVVAIAVAGGPLSGARAAAAAVHKPPRCRTSQLSAQLVAGSPGAGQRYATLVLTNTSRRTCRVFGYEGMQLLDGAGHNVPTNVVRVAKSKRHRVVVAPSGAASAALHWGAVSARGEPTSGPCEPAAQKVMITPPDEFTHLVIAWTLGEVCDHGRIETGPLVKGSTAGA